MFRGFVNADELKFHEELFILRVTLKGTRISFVILHINWKFIT